MVVLRAPAVVVTAWLIVACSPKPTEAAAPVKQKETCLPGVAIAGDPNGLAWDAPRERLLIADAANNRLLAWHPGQPVTTLADLPLDGGKPGLGQPVVDQNGVVLVPRFGYGASGTIVRVLPNGSIEMIGGLDANRRRIGLSFEGARLFETYFVKGPEQPSGGVAEVSPDGAEMTLAPFQKPIGVLAGKDALYVSDQEKDAIFRCAPRAPADCTRFASLSAPDPAKADSRPANSRGPRSMHAQHERDAPLSRGARCRAHGSTTWSGVRMTSWFGTRASSSPAVC